MLCNQLLRVWNSRCGSLHEASVLLEEMRLFDRRVYGVAHGLLMGSRDLVWAEAEGLFDEIARMDYATGAAFYNALTDVLWHFGQVGLSNEKWLVLCPSNLPGLFREYEILLTTLG